MTTTMRPTLGQVWQHKQYGTEMEVVEVSGTRVRIQGVGRPGYRIGMDEAQLVEHYAYVR